MQGLFLHFACYLGSDSRCGIDLDGLSALHHPTRLCISVQRLPYSRKSVSFVARVRSIYQATCETSLFVVSAIIYIIINVVIIAVVGVMVVIVVNVAAL